MRRTAHLGLALLALGAVLASALLVAGHREDRPPRATVPLVGGPDPQPAAATTTVRDASGAPAPVRAYRRICSVSTIADAVLPDLVHIDRIVSVHRHFAEHHPLAFRTAGKLQVDSAKELERIVALEPDIVFVSSFGGQLAHLERLRENGVTVFDLGEMRGLRTLLDDIRDIGAVLAVPERGRALAAALHRRMVQVAAHIPLAERRRGIYLNTLGGQLIGGTAGSSFHDVISAAGLIDIAAETGSFSPWPQYTVEQVIALDPEVIVTATGKGAALRERPGLANLRALRDPDGVVELPHQRLQDAGPGMLRSAELLHDRLYPDRRAPSTLAPVQRRALEDAAEERP